MSDSVSIIAVAADMAAPAFFHLLALAALGGIIVAACCEAWGKARQKIFLDKYAQQVASMSLLFFLFALAVGVAGAFVGKGATAKFMEMVDIPGSPFTALAAALGASLILGGVHSLFWNKMKSIKVLHMAIGLLAAVCSLVSVVLLMDMVRGMLPMLVSEQAIAQWPTLPAQDSPLWSLVLRQIFLALAYAGALSLPYLIHRRKHDDFGRDYYGFSLRTAAKWALFPMIPALFCQGWLYALSSTEMKTLLSSGTLAPAWWGTVGAAVLCCILWTLLAKSPHPMRLKGAALASSVLAWALNALDLTLNMNILLAG